MLKPRAGWFMAVISLVGPMGCAQRDARSAPPTARQTPAQQPGALAAPADQGPPTAAPASPAAAEPASLSDVPRAAPPGNPATELGPTGEPLADAHAPGSEAPPDVPAPLDAEPELPPYLRVLERRTASGPFSLDSQRPSAGELRIATGNVQRFSLNRGGLPGSAGRRMIVRIDGQNLEWTARYWQIELARSPQGLWEVVATEPAR